MLRVEGLEVRYGPVRSVNGVSFVVDSGESVGLLGPNGAGKSSTLNGIVGLVRAKAFRLEFEGEDLRLMSTEQRLRRGIALVPQGRQLFPNLTVADNIRTGRWVSSGRRQRELEPAIVDLFPQLRSRLGQRAGTLSGGEQQMCAIARAIASHPKLLLLDEPSMGLSPKMVSSVVDQLREIAQSTGMSMFVVEQGVGVLTRLTKRILIMAGGRVTSEAFPEDVDAAQRLERTYFA